MDLLVVLEGLHELAILEKEIGNNFASFVEAVVCLDRLFQILNCPWLVTLQFQMLGNARV